MIADTIPFHNIPSHPIPHQTSENTFQAPHGNYPIPTYILLWPQVEAHKRHWCCCCRHTVAQTRQPTAGSSFSRKSSYRFFNKEPARAQLGSPPRTNNCRAYHTIKYDAISHRRHPQSTHTTHTYRTEIIPPSQPCGMGASSAAVRHTATSRRR